MPGGDDQSRAARRTSTSDGPPNLRRSSAQMPVTRQVGFHVEGVPPSPAQEATLAEQHLQAGAKVAAGSPSPVIIPPTFQSSTADQLRTTSLPVDAAAAALPDSHLADVHAGHGHRSPTHTSMDVQTSAFAQHESTQRREDGTSPKHAARLLRGGSAAAVMSPAPDLMLAAAHTSDGLHRVETSPAAVPAGASRTPFNSHDEPHVEPGQTEGRLQRRTSLPQGQDSPAQPQGRRAAPPATPPGSQSPLGGRQPPPGAAQLRAASDAAGPWAGTPDGAAGGAVQRRDSGERQHRGSEHGGQAGVGDGGTFTRGAGSAADSAVTTAGRRDDRQQQQQPPQQQPEEKKSRAALRAEQRAKQEAQRAAKAARQQQQGGKGQAGGGKGGGRQPSSDVSSAIAASVGDALASAPPRRPGADEATSARGGKQQQQQQSPQPQPQQQQPGGGAQSQKRGQRRGGAKAGTLQSAELFSHLQQYKRVTVEGVLGESELAAAVHPAVLQLGLRYADGSIRGASARCIAMLSAFRRLVQDYKTPEGKVLSRDLTAVLNTAIQFLVECRPLAITMGNAIKFLKTQVSKLDPTVPESDAKAAVVRIIDTYIQEKIAFAGDVLVRNAVVKVVDDDVVLTYAFSSIILNILLRAQQEGKHFRVVVADSRPALEGREMLRRLLEAGVSSTYLDLNALTYIMPEVSKVFLGAAAVHSNGTVMARIGSASVAMAADARGVPVIICCETYKFVAKVQLDSITSNELGDPGALTSVAGRPDITTLADWQSQPNLALLSLSYDAMPAEYASVIITEFGAIPPTSVPVILREYQTEPTM